MELSVQRPSSLGKRTQRSAKYGGKSSASAWSPPQERRAGVVEGIVRIGIMGLPAVAPQGTVPADLLRPPGQTARRGFPAAAAARGPPGCHTPPGRPPQVLRPPETPPPAAVSSIPSFSGSSSHTPAAVSNWHSTARGRTSPSSRAGQHTRGAEGRGRRHSLSSPQPCGSGCGNAQHHRQIQLSRAAPDPASAPASAPGGPPASGARRASHEI